MEKLVFSSIPVQDLKELIALEISKVIEGKLNVINSTSVPEDFLTRKQTAQILNVSLPTLHEWTMSGKLPAYRIGTRIRYKRKEIEKSLRLINVVRKEVGNV